MLHSTISYVDANDARNYLLTLWYNKTDASHLLFVDADMGFGPQLIFDMVALDKPITGVIYPKRQIDLQRLATLAAEGEKPERAIAAMLKTLPAINDTSPRKTSPLAGGFDRLIRAFDTVDGQHAMPSEGTPAGNHNPN
jgi:hypothetical protein